MSHSLHPISVLVGLLIVFVAIIILQAAFRNMLGGSCLTGCCLEEIGSSLMELGCGLIGCGTLASLGLIGVGVTSWFLHR